MRYLVFAIGLGVWILAGVGVVALVRGRVDLGQCVTVGEGR